MIVPLWLATTAAVSLLHGCGTDITPAYEIGSSSNTAVATSIGSARTAVAGHKVIVADVEKWEYTPAYQQAHPAFAIQRICEIAHEHGEKCIAAPALDLFGSPAAYLAAHVTKVANYADAWEVQAQTLELYPSRYKAFVTKVIRQARAVNSHILALAGLTTSSRVGDVTGPKLWTALNSVYPKVVRGFWANIPGNGPKCPTCGSVNPKPMVYVLKKLQS